MLIMSPMPLSNEMDLKNQRANGGDERRPLQKQARSTESTDPSNSVPLSASEFLKMARLRQLSVFEGSKRDDLESLVREMDKVALSKSPSSEVEEGELVAKAPIRPEVAVLRKNTGPYTTKKQPPQGASLTAQCPPAARQSPAEFMAQQRQMQQFSFPDGNNMPPASSVCPMPDMSDGRCPMPDIAPYGHHASAGFRSPGDFYQTPSPPVGIEAYFGGRGYTAEQSQQQRCTYQPMYSLPYSLPSPEEGTTGSVSGSPELCRAILSGSPDFTATGSPAAAATGQSANQQAAAPLKGYHPRVPSSVELDSMVLGRSELPDELANFILKYSRDYSDHEHGSDVEDEQGNHVNLPYPFGSGDNSDADSVSLPSPSVSSGAGSPPLLGTQATSPKEKLRANIRARQDEKTKDLLKVLTPRRTSPLQRRKSTSARDRLQKSIEPEVFEKAWAWAAKSWRVFPDALCFLRDADGDSILHRVVYHRDIAKTYAMVEHMLKDEHPLCPKPFDLPNCSNETPLFVAVQRRLPEVTAYLLECGANPNVRIRNRAGDTSLHYAAARGMTEMVATLVACPRTEVNAFNVAGMTPLLCAVKYHGVIEEENQCLVNNKPAIRTLLKHGADPLVQNSSSGKTVLHYAVERMDPDLVEVFTRFLPRDSMRRLANLPSVDGQTPIALLGRGQEELRRKVCFALLDAGAEIVQLEE